METLIALALATPVWGFALEAPLLTAPPAGVDVTAQTDAGRWDPTPSLEEDLAAEAEAAREEAPSAAFRNGHASTMMDWTRATNLAATIALGATAVFGLIQFADEYGFNSNRLETACATGDAVLSRCGEETPWEHAIGAATSASLLLTSFVLSTQVDFDIAGARDGDWRTYETTRWVVLGLAVAQALGGFLLANSERWGWLDRQNDFGVMQGLAIGHFALGATTLGFQLANTVLVF